MVFENPGSVAVSPRRLALLWFTALGLLWAPDSLQRTAQASPRQDSDSYDQLLEITFADAESAKQAKLTIAPLYDDFRRAVSCRWDDNWTSDNPQTRELMEEFGISGTWYLNGQHFSPDHVPRGDYTPVARQLLKGGNSIGGHSLTHPYLTYFHHNRMFAEMSGVRIAWESALDKPVLSYAYSFVDLRPEPEGREVLLRSLNTLERAGYYHVSEYLNFFDDIDLTMELSPIMPPENNSLEVFQTAVEWAYSEPRLTEQWPMVTNSMHAWYGTERLPYGYDELRKRFAILAELKDVWHCNQNQYAAYRRQFHRSTISELPANDRQRRFRIQRPKLVALNDDTPLTLMVSGVDSKSILGLNCKSAAVEASQRDREGASLYHLNHDRDQQLPIKIAHIANPANDTNHKDSPSDFPDLSGVLFRDADRLQLKLAWTEPESFHPVRVAWRVPVGWKVDLPVQYPAANPDNEWTITQTLAPSNDRDARWGQCLYVAEVDFLYKDQPGRIHFTCQSPGEPIDNSLPGSGFSVLGPIPNQEWDLQRFMKQMIDTGTERQNWHLEDGTTLEWRKDSTDGYVNQQWLNPEYVRTMGTWDTQSPTYVLRSKVQTPIGRDARLQISHADRSVIILNGKITAGDRLRLNPGSNDLVIVYPGAKLQVETQRLAACFIRLTDPDSGRRLPDVRYQPY